MIIFKMENFVPSVLISYWLCLPANMADMVDKYK